VGFDLVGVIGSNGGGLSRGSALAMTCLRSFKPVVRIRVFQSRARLRVQQGSGKAVAGLSGRCRGTASLVASLVTHELKVETHVLQDV
jgi:hypothetical protein